MFTSESGRSWAPRIWVRKTLKRSIYRIIYRIGLQITIILINPRPLMCRCTHFSKEMWVQPTCIDSPASATAPMLETGRACCGDEPWEGQKPGCRIVVWDLNWCRLASLLLLFGVWEIKTLQFRSKGIWLSLTFSERLLIKRHPLTLADSIHCLPLVF